MNKITLGKTGLVIEKNGLGCLPIQRISEQDAVYLLHKRAEGRRGVLRDARQGRSRDKDGRTDIKRNVEGSGDKPSHAENRLY